MVADRHGRAEWLIVKAFAAAILVGAFLLATPWASRRGEWTPALDALFTATSATCVTGLTVVDTGSHFSRFGQLVLLALIQLGGLGIMTVGTFLLVLIGRRLGLRDEFVLIDSLGSDRIQGLRSLLGRAVLFTAAMELAGAALLAWRLAAHGLDGGQAVYSGVFHSVSAFCNAGFSLFPDNLIGLQRDPVFLLTAALLIVAGGIGFLVLHDLSFLRPAFWQRGRRARLSLHSKVVLQVSLWLILGGWVALTALEWGRTLAPLGLRDKLVVGLFQSVTPRTAGFNAVDMAHMHPASLFVTMGLMFVGGSPCSTAGGVKTTTVAVLLLVVFMLLRGKVEVELYGRRLPLHVVREALSVFFLGLLLVCAAFGVLLVTEAPPQMARELSVPDELLFETISAFGTVGLSTGITASLTGIGKGVVIVLMFVGRLGPLTLAVALGQKAIRQVIRYPEEGVVVG
jgi:trk system potassium uptake protein TrkH